MSLVWGLVGYCCDGDGGDVVTGELPGTGHDGRSSAGQSGLCQAADREWREHESLPDDSSPGGALQHGEAADPLRGLVFPLFTALTVDLLPDEFRPSSTAHQLTRGY